MIAAQYEHCDVNALKHILKTISFAKKFVSVNMFDP